VINTPPGAFTPPAPRPPSPDAGDTGSGEIVNVGALSISASRPLFNRNGRLISLTVAESTGAAAARVALLDGADTGGELLVPVSVISGGTQTVNLGERGIPVRSGLFLQVIAGSVSIGAFIRVPDDL
jgi:hypothetical protein